MKKQKRIFQIEIAVSVFLIILLVWASSYKIANLKAEAQRSITLKNHGRIIDAIAVYRGDNKGACPSKLEDIVPDYMDKIPSAYCRKGNKSNAVRNGFYAEAFDGSGGWVYINAPADQYYCKVFPNTF